MMDHRERDRGKCLLLPSQHLRFANVHRLTYMSWQHDTSKVEDLSKHMFRYLVDCVNPRCAQ